MKQIRITRDGLGKVTFETVSIDGTETVFFTNLDPLAVHWPDLSSNQLGKAPSPNSSQTPIDPPAGKTPPCQVTYGCKMPGHQQEQGIINLFALLSAATTSLTAAIVGKPIVEQQVVSGGVAPYTITGQLYDVVDGSGKVIQSGSGVGPGLQLNARTSELGITVTGTPTVVGTYNFTFTVNDAVGHNLQQVQYSMLVTLAST